MAAPSGHADRIIVPSERRDARPEYQPDARLEYQPNGRYLRAMKRAGYVWVPGKFEWIRHRRVFVAGHFEKVRRVNGGYGAWGR